MTFTSHDAFPARGGVGDDRRFDPVPGTEVRDAGPAPYVELHAHSAYSFLDGASLPEELAARAAELGYDALALTDHDGVYGSLEFAYAAKHFGVRPITGAEVTIEGGTHLTLLCETQGGYANLCRILTDAHAGTRPEGREHRELLPAATTVEFVVEHAEGLVCLSGCARHGLATRDAAAATHLAASFRRLRSRQATAIRWRRRSRCYASSPSTGPGLTSPLTANEWCTLPLPALPINTRISTWCPSRVAHPTN